MTDRPGEGMLCIIVRTWMKYAALIGLHMALQFIAGQAAGAAGPAGLPEWAVRIMIVPLSVPMLLAFYITFQNERIHFLIRWYFRFMAIVLLAVLAATLMGFGEVMLSEGGFGVNFVR